MQRDVALGQTVAHEAELNLDDLLQILQRQRLEDDDLVDPVQELRAEVLSAARQTRVSASRPNSRLPGLDIAWIRGYSS